MPRFKKETEMHPSKFGRLLPLAILVAIALLVAAPAPAADDEGGEFGVLFGTGHGDKDLVGEHREWDPSILAGLRFGNVFADHWGFFIDGIYIPFNGVGPSGDADELAARLGVEWLTSPENDWRFFVAGALGGMHVSPEFGESFDRGLVSLGIGVRHPFGERGRFRMELRGEQTVTDDELGGEGLLNAHFILGWAWGFGPPKDTDGDGVIDRRDECPGTPQGATVDAKGCPKDSDGDGVFDGIDRCPDTEKGTPVDEVGCPKDSDGDGVHDGIDACPNTPKGVKVDAKGCPVDSDGDGVHDGIDACPNTPKGTAVDAKGCPLPKAAPLFEEGKKTLVLEGVNFEFNSAVLTADALVVLDRVAESLKASPDVKVEVGGHTDSKGSNLYNLKLSADRSRSVLKRLIDKGVNPGQLTAKGYGETAPIADNDTDEGRAKNRRVELKKQD
jgi:OOP family OmpA-OmpF porin